MQQFKNNLLNHQNYFGLQYQNNIASRHNIHIVLRDFLYFIKYKVNYRERYLFSINKYLMRPNESLAHIFNLLSLKLHHDRI